MRRIWAMGILLAMVLPSCKIGEWAGDASSPSVVVIGDSLVFGSERSLGGTETWITDDLVAAGNRAYVTGWVGSTMNFAYPTLWAQPSRQGVSPDVLVIALGSNDMRVDVATGEAATTPAAASVLVRAWLAEVPDACVRLVGVAESVVGWGLDTTGPGWNAMLESEAALHPDGAFVAWEPLPEWTQNGASPHLTQAGKDAYRALLVGAAASCSG